MKLYWLSAKEVRDKILAGEVKAEEVLAETFERIENVEGKINAFITLCKEEAFKKAKEVDSKIAIGEKTGILAGIPVAIKDNISTKGIRTTCGSKMLYNYIPPYNATVVEKLEDEDAVIIGKTNMDEFAMGTTTETSYFGPTRNPWDTSKVPGGSSGGSAAAVASGEAFLALGSDTGGSIRCPASFCGVVGLKPTYGLVSRYGLIAYANSFEQIGPIARNVYDCALLLSVIAGWDGRDSTSINVEDTNYLIKLNGKVGKLKVGIVKEMVDEGVDEAVLKIFYRYVSKLESLNIMCDEVSMPTIRYAIPVYYLIAMSEASSNLARFDGVRYGYSLKVEDETLDWNRFYSKNRGSGFGAEVKRRIILGTYALSAGYYDKFFLKSLKVLTLIKRDFDEAFKKFDVLISPTMPIPPFKLGEKIDDPLSLYLCDIDTVPANLTGIPAVSIPCGFHHNLPVGVQIMAPQLREELVLRFALLSEDVVGLKNLKPDI
ncbi:MAG: Asp-tRNA(Asn)/Glu-tRNA(Gln) amidotransferase subunit GatA [Candidatus Bathyarchaeota archaeon]|nr:Asp-tRNA(Asn)/Glu-tRNA(Gln) amidotransferase subunit GatA [Candidatus Bathyarchaeota archaeon]